MVDTGDLKSPAGDGVRVQFPPATLKIINFFLKNRKIKNVRFLFLKIRYDESVKHQSTETGDEFPLRHFRCRNWSTFLLESWRIPNARTSTY